MGRFDLLLSNEKPKTQPRSPRLPSQEEERHSLKSGKPEIMKRSDQEIMKSGKPEIMKPAEAADRQPAKVIKKYSSLLTEESIKAIKMLALDAGKKDYEILQQALDEYLQRKR